MSRRCLPVDEAKKLISFNPPVDFRIASGEGGFNILGNFKRGNYAMNIESGMRTIDGGVVKSPFTSEVTIPSRSPSITFVNKGEVPLPLPYRVTLADGTVLDLELPVEAWATTDKFRAIIDAGGEKIQRVEIDPRGLIPDINPRDNVWSR